MVKLWKRILSTLLPVVIMALKGSSLGSVVQLTSEVSKRCEMTLWNNDFSLSILNRACVGREVFGELKHRADLPKISLNFIIFKRFDSFNINHDVRLRKTRLTSRDVLS